MLGFVSDAFLLGCLFSFFLLHGIKLLLLWNETLEWYSMDNAPCSFQGDVASILSFQIACKERH